MAVMSGGDNGAWQQMERGEISLTEFGQKFSQEVSSRVSLYFPDICMCACICLFVYLVVLSII